MNETVYSVSELNTACRKLLEASFTRVLVEGEISNFSRPYSGHWYFSLKDDKAQVRCAMFRSQNSRVDFTPKDGLQVQIKAKVSIYPDRGDYQLIVDDMVAAGDGLLRQKYEALVKKLAAEGLFQSQWKKQLPVMPKRIGVITSPTGAAIRDIITTLKRRFPSIPVRIYPTQVQGAEAAPQIVQAIQLAVEQNACDVLIVGRGGGSLEDLWPFNEEIVARALFDCPIPTVSGVGHEIDFTIADLVADQRAATPTAAAELVSPNQQEWLDRIQQLEKRCADLIRTKLNDLSQRVDGLTKRLRHPGQIITQQLQLCEVLKKRLARSIQQWLTLQEQRFRQLLHTLNAVSPLATLERGYSIVTDHQSGKVITQSSVTQAGSLLDIKLYQGNLHCRVESVDDLDIAN